MTRTTVGRPTRLDAVVALGEGRTVIALSTPSGLAQLSEAQMRNTALQFARRALTVAQELETVGQFT